jgi:hypothetical protein
MAATSDLDRIFADIAVLEAVITRLGRQATKRL